MSTTAILLIVLILCLLGGGGFYYMPNRVQPEPGQPVWAPNDFVGILLTILIIALIIGLFRAI